METTSGPVSHPPLTRFESLFGDKTSMAVNPYADLASKKVCRA